MELVQPRKPRFVRVESYKQILNALDAGNSINPIMGKQSKKNGNSLMRFNISTISRPSRGLRQEKGNPKSGLNPLGSPRGLLRSLTFTALGEPFLFCNKLRATFCCVHSQLFLAKNPSARKEHDKYHQLGNSPVNEASKKARICIFSTIFDR